MHVRPITPALLAAEAVERIAALPGRWHRVAVDGALSEDTAAFADGLVEPLRARGHQVVRVRLADYVRPASLRLEHGRRDPDSFHDDWFDFDAVRREVLDPLADGGTGSVLPALWDAEHDRSPRLPRVALNPGGAAIVDGPLLLGGLPFDFAAHLWLSPAALRRRMPPEEHWTLPAFERYAAEVAPQHRADLLVRTDHPDKPAIIDQW
ncbi:MULTISPECIES: uridine kinase [Saccharopolyspora]|uniref:Uridine kinase n=1 Tax=Saccharopolyspora cebuensis TaxID=418759 RepID=A0ABV4CD00_9PSEU